MSKYLPKKLVVLTLYVTSMVIFNFVFLFSTITYSLLHGNLEYYRAIYITFLLVPLTTFIVSLIIIFFINIKMYIKFLYVLLGLLFCFIGPVLSKSYNYLPDLLFFHTRHQQFTEFAELINSNESITSLMLFGNEEIYINSKFATYNKNWTFVTPYDFVQLDSVYYKYVIEKLNITETRLDEYIKELDDLNIQGFRKKGGDLEFDMYYAGVFKRRVFVYSNKPYIQQSDILEFEKINDNWYWVVYSSI